MMFDWALVAVLCAGAAPDRAAELKLPDPLPEGLRLLLEKPYLPADFDWEVFDNLWRVWEEPRRAQAASASREARRGMAFERYGLIGVAGRANGLPLQYTAASYPAGISPTGSRSPKSPTSSGWAMNCFACHGGSVAGKPVLGAPNSLYAMQTLYEEVRAVKMLLGKKFAHMDVGSLVVPLGGSVGTTNAIVFGIALGANRDADLNFRRKLFPPKLLHHDHDAPPWWHVHDKTQLYLDGFAPKEHRALMQFFLVEANGPERYRAWEDDYRKILAWIETLRPPPYPGPVDRRLAARGKLAFDRTCAQCHGIQGSGGNYPQTVVPIDQIGTDRARHDAIEPGMREGYRKSWFGRNVAERVVVDSAGYVAPPLAGVWASAPYLHNGSVPTLWHLLHPDQRPQLWRRARHDYDHERVGLQFEAPSKLPAALSAAESRWYFDTRQFGKSAAGHLYPNKLSDAEKSAVLEYLKTL